MRSQQPRKKEADQKWPLRRRRRRRTLRLGVRANPRGERRGAAEPVDGAGHVKRRAGPRRSRSRRARRRYDGAAGRGSETSCRTRTRPRCRRAAHLPKAMSRWRWRGGGAVRPQRRRSGRCTRQRAADLARTPATTRRSDASSSSSASTRSKEQERALATLSPQVGVAGRDHAEITGWLLVIAFAVTSAVIEQAR